MSRRPLGFSTSVGIGLFAYGLLATAFNPSADLVTRFTEMPDWQMAVCALVALAFFALSEWRQRWGSTPDEEKDRLRGESGRGDLMDIGDD